MKRAGAVFAAALPLGLALALGPAPACVRIAEDRALRDLEIGKAEAGDARVSVDEGLAAVRRFEPGKLSLWTEAPVLTARLRVGPQSGGAWEITVQNTLADEALSAETTAGEALPVTLAPPAEAPIPTEKTWLIKIPEGAEVVLTLRPPDADLLDPWRFAMLADVQERIGDVQDIYSKMNEDPTIRFCLFHGDLTSMGSAEQLEKFQREMRTLNFPIYATLGNHELGTGDDLFQTYFGRASFQFAFRGVHFTLLDSASSTIDPLVYEQLDTWLARGRNGLHVVTTHFPPIDPVGTRNGAFASRAEADKFLTLLANAGVDLTVYGHVHSFYAFANAGIPAYISGGGGAIPERLDGIGRHFITVDVHPGEKLEDPSPVRVD